MAAKKFRFVSPGVQIKEIDKSILPALPGAIGPVVIGRSLKGPAMVPVTVNSYEDFVQKFGEPSPGVSNRDIWRNGNDTGPTYGAYAAKAWLESSTPLTFLRLAGVQNSAADSNGLAGWQTHNLKVTSSIEDNGGAYGLFLCTTGSAGQEKGTLAATFYLEKGSIEMVGQTPNDVSVGDGTNGGANVFVTCTKNLGFKVKIHTTGSASETVSFDFDKNSKQFIRKAFNTNPTLSNGTINKSAKTYWLGESFEDELAEKLGDEDVLLSSEEEVVGFIAPLWKGDKSLANFRKEARPAKTGWVISQHLNADTDSFAAEEQPRLFRLVAGEGLGGDFEQNNYKISILDIKPPKNSFQKYGTFSVAVRRIGDKDTSPEFVEVFSNLNLDPSSPNYIASRIGDRRIVWKDDRLVELGTYSNNSKIIRVEMSDAVENGEIPSEALPFGFFGPTRFKEFTLSGSITGLVSSSLDNSIVYKTVANITGAYSGSNGFENGVQTEIPNFDGKIVMPSLPLLVSASAVDPSNPSLAYFGLKTEEPLNESIKDLLRIKPLGFDSCDITSETTGSLEYSFVFTLDDLSGSSSPVWKEGSRTEGTSWTATDASGFEAVLSNEYNKFTMPLVGGFDGLDIKEREPFRNSLLDEESTEKSSYVFNSLKRAVDSVKDPEVLDMNLLMLPGVTNKAITNRMIRVCEDRADAMAIIDLEGGYVPSTENNKDEDSRLGSVSETLASAGGRGFNTSYACAYYPWVQMQDDNTGNKLWIPPSVVAFGTMASSQEDSEVWFAPAGFNRGGLTLGSSGLSVLNVRDKLTAKDRDSLYEVSINPIASFPSEGLVIFGQKTLQAVPSALDRINVRRLVIFLKKEISRIASGLLFEPNVEQTWKRFSVPTTRLLEEVKSGFGISDYRVVLDSTTTTPEEIDRNMMYAKLFIKPVYAIEFIGIDFVITNTGASFDDL